MKDLTEVPLAVIGLIIAAIGLLFGIFWVISYFERKDCADSFLPDGGACPKPGQHIEARAGRYVCACERKP